MFPWTYPTDYRPSLAEARRDTPKPTWTAKARHPYYHNIGRTGKAVIESPPMTRKQVMDWCRAREANGLETFDVREVS